MDRTMKPKRGILRVQDLYARSERRPGSTCWIWSGPASDGLPAIWTLDYGRAEKRVMSAPLAVYNITFKAPPPEGHVAYMRCMKPRCVRPECVTSGTRSQFGAAVAASGRLIGAVPREKKLASLRKARAAAGIVDTPQEIVLALLSAPRSESHQAAADRVGVSLKTAWYIRTGRRHADAAAGRAA